MVVNVFLLDPNLAVATCVIFLHSGKTDVACNTNHNYSTYLDNIHEQIFQNIFPQSVKFFIFLPIFRKRTQDNVLLQTSNILSQRWFDSISNYVIQINKALYNLEFGYMLKIL